MARNGRSMSLFQGRKRKRRPRIHLTQIHFADKIENCRRDKFPKSALKKELVVAKQLRTLANSFPEVGYGSRRGGRRGGYK